MNGMAELPRFVLEAITFGTLVSLILLAAYLILAWFSARERPP